MTSAIVFMGFSFCLCSTENSTTTVNCLSSASGIVVAALSNGSVTVVDTDNRRILRTVSLCQGPIQVALLLTFADIDDETTRLSPTWQWQLADTKMRHWLPLYLQKAYSRKDSSVSSNGSLLLTCGGRPCGNMHCHPTTVLGGEPNGQEAATLCIWDGRFVLQEK